MDRKILYLINLKHLHHVVIIDHDGSEPVEERKQGVVLPVGATGCTVFCVECDVMLVEGEDYVMEDYRPSGGREPAHGGPDEPWARDPDAWKG